MLLSLKTSAPTTGCLYRACNDFAASVGLKDCPQKVGITRIYLLVELADLLIAMRRPFVSILLLVRPSSCR